MGARSLVSFHISATSPAVYFQIFRYFECVKFAGEIAEATVKSLERFSGRVTLPMHFGSILIVHAKVESRIKIIRVEKKANIKGERNRSRMKNDRFL